jgi:type I restriction enzyme S subunit
VTSDLPDGWARTTLGQLADSIRNGLFASRPTSDPPGTPILRISAVRLGEVLLEGHRYVPDPGAERIDQFRLEVGDLLVTRYNGSRPLVGGCGLVKATVDGLIYPDKLIRVRLPREKVSAAFITAVVNSPVTRAFLEPRIRTTAGQSGISGPDVKSIPIALPPQAEQQRIAAILDEALSLRKHIASALNGLERRLSVCEEAWLRSAVTGGLPHSDREPATDLLDELGVTPLQGAGGDFPDLPMGWLWCRLGDIADVTGGVTKDVKTQGRDGLVEVPYLRVANVQRGALRLDNVSTIQVAPSKLEMLRLLAGDVLMNEGGDRDKLGRGWVWEGQIDNCIHQNHVFRARVRGGLLDPKLLSWFGNTWGQRYFEQHGKQTTNLASVSLRTLKSLSVPIPPISVQGDLVATIDETLELVARMRSGLGALRARVDVLQRSLLTGAVEGRLVPQDPNDEPAEQLLKRITQDREAVATQAAPTRTIRRRAAAAPNMSKEQLA